MPILRLVIYQPQAHYRIPFSIQRRHTFPIPPYSTIIGFLCNVCGIDDQNKDLYKNGIRKLKISLAGRFKVKLTEMLWFRNLSEKAHENTYGSIDNRKKNGQIGHIGGQSPVKIDILEDLELILHLYHDETNILDKLKNNLENPVNRLQVLHIGRAEDWIVFQEIKLFENDNIIEWKRKDSQYPYFFWIPEQIYQLNKNHHQDKTNQQNEKNLCWDSFDGLFYNLTTFSNIEDYETHYNHTGKRIYQRIKAKLNDGKIINTTCYFDKELDLPVFFANFE